MQLLRITGLIHTVKRLKDLPIRINVSQGAPHAFTVIALPAPAANDECFAEEKREDEPPVTS